MSVSLIGEFSLIVQVDRILQYGDLEQAILAAGFSDYTIVRQLGEDRTDAQITVRDVSGSMPAPQTLSALADAVGALESTSVSARTGAGVSAVSDSDSETVSDV